MWNQVFSAVITGMQEAFIWLDALFDSIPGAWAYVSATIIIFLIAMHLLVPLTGMVLRAGVSDTVSGRAEARAEKDKKHADEIKMLGGRK